MRKDKNCIKKYFPMLLAILFALSLTACSSTDKTKKKDDTSASTEETDDKAVNTLDNTATSNAAATDEAATDTATAGEAATAADKATTDTADDVTTDTAAIDGAVTDAATTDEAITDAETTDNTAAAASKRDMDALKSQLVEAYVGMTKAGTGVYYAGNEDGTIGLLVLLNPETTQHYVYSGSIADNGDGTLTITDDRDAITLTFSITETENGLELDMGEELGKAVIAEAAVDEVINMMIQIENNSTDVASEATDPFSTLKDQLTEAYTGSFSDRSTFYIAGNADSSMMITVIVSPDQKQSITFIGNATSTDSELTITDNRDGQTIQMVASKENDTPVLLLPNFGNEKVTLRTMELSAFVSEIERIRSETEAVR